MFAAPDAARVRPSPRASQTEDEETSGAESRPKPAKKKKLSKKKLENLLTGDEWAKRHGDEWQTFLQQKLKKCECAHPIVSNSNRAKCLKDDDGDGIAPAEPAACLMCFAPIDQEVRRSLCCGWRAMSPRPRLRDEPRPEPRPRRRHDEG